MSIPDYFEKKPMPQEMDRPFGGKRLHAWYGFIDIEKVEGWVDNPRITLQAKKMKEMTGDRPLTQDEVFEIMKNDSKVRIKALRDDILKNGVKEPLILSKKLRLLDGNRRFFAVKLLLEGMSQTDPSRSDYSKLPVYVLSGSTSNEDEAMVLVEENFSPSHKQEWPDYVKAIFIKKDWDDGLATDDIAVKYNWPKRKVSETLNIIKIQDDFISYAEGEVDMEDEFGGGLGLSENDAERMVSDNFQFFNEAQKSFRNQLESDIDFKINFFKWIASKKFASFPEVRVAYEAWTDPEARSVLMSDEPTAAKEAKAILDYKKRVIKGKNEAKLRVEDFIKFLDGMTTAEISGIPEATLEKLKNSMELVIKMVEASKK